MLIKNMSRSGGGSGPVLRYILRYVFRDQEDERQHVISPEPLSKRDIAHIKAELVDNEILGDITDKGLEKNHSKYVQKYLLPKLEKLEELDGPVEKPKEKPFIIKHNLRSKDLNGFIREFEKNESGRIHKRSDQPNVHHTVLSWHRDDSSKITEAMLMDMAKEYIKLRGTNNIYCGTVHRDRAHLHIHLAMSATDIFGKSSSIRIAEFEQVKTKFAGLHDSEISFFG